MEDWLEGYKKDSNKQCSHLSEKDLSRRDNFMGKYTATWQIRFYQNGVTNYQMIDISILFLVDSFFTSYFTVS